MMKKILLILFMIIAFILGGCANQGDQAYDQAMKKGQAALVSKDYDAAANDFKQALHVKNNDQKAERLLTQINQFLAAKEMADQPDQAIKKLNAVIAQTGASDSLRRDAQVLKKQMMTTNRASVTVTSPNEETSGASSSSSSASTSSSGNSETPEADRASSSSSTAVSPQKQAETAVIKAAGYTPDQVYVITTDKGAYYSLELRENHAKDSAADPNTAPSIGFFRYYKNSGKITQLDLLSNTYKTVR